MPQLRTLATGLAASRVAFGAGMIVAPGVNARTWIGPFARREPAKVLSRALGARDLAIGAAGLLTLRAGDAARTREWFAVQALTDTVDLGATLAAGRALPALQRRFTVTAAAVSVGIAVATAVQAARDVEAPSGPAGP